MESASGPRTCASWYCRYLRTRSSCFSADERRDQPKLPAPGAEAFLLSLSSLPVPPIKADTIELAPKASSDTSGESPLEQPVARMSCTASKAQNSKTRPTMEGMRAKRALL